MVLLDLLHQLSKTYGWKITLAHFNHQLRGRRSDADETLVKKTADKLKLKFVAGSGDVKKFAQHNKLSVEMAARKLRHEFLARTAKRLRIETVALAHHADDQVELFFLRLLRGTGTEGLAGMGWESPSPADRSIRLVRPLLGQTKELLRDYATAERISFREDASNAQPDFRRNRIRNEVIPLLKTIQPSVKKTILRAMEIAGWESNFVLGAALEWLNSTQRPPLDQLHIAVQRICLRLQMRALGFPSNFDLVEQLRARPNRTVSVDSENFLYRDAAGMVYPRITKASSFNEAEIQIDLTEQNGIEFGGQRVCWAFQNKRGALCRRKSNCEFFDAKKVGAKISLRHWKAGDRFQPIGLKTSVKLQNLFTDFKIPRDQRHRRIIAVTASGEIFWVEGLRISDRFKLDKQSARRLKWVWRCSGQLVAGGSNPC